MTSKPLVAITGASSGIGAALASLHAADGWDVIMVNRSVERSQPVVDRIRSESPDASVEVIQADLARLDSIARAAETLRERDRIDRFINNAGVLLGEKVMSEHGVEMHAQVNTLAPYLFGRWLSPVMEGVVMALVTTSAISRAKTLAVEELADPSSFRKLFGPYVQSKLAATAIMDAFAREYPAITFRSTEPGAVKTSMTRGDGMPRWLVPIRNLFFASPEKGARRIFDSVNAPRADYPSGAYVQGGKRRALPADAGDPAVQKALLAWCQEITGV
ncbi:MAG: SDR family NAD(P)-dependent oxidoreductase [Acidobacteriota bacterium]